MCWVAFDRGHPAGRPSTGVRRRWTAGAPSGTRSTTRSWSAGWSAERQAFVQHYDDRRAGLLAAADVDGRLHLADGPDVASTLDAMDDELVTDSLVYRYDPEASPDGLRGSEGTFSLCTFMYVDALARAGRLDEARADLREDADLRQPPRPVLRGDRAHRRADRQLPAGVHPPRPDRRRHHAGPATRSPWIGRAPTAGLVGFRSRNNADLVTAGCGSRWIRRHFLWRWTDPGD